MVESSERDVLITGGDLATLRYPCQQQGTSQLQSSTSQQQTQHQQEQLHNQATVTAAAAHQAVPPYPRSIHQMHYTSAYPSNYYSPYSGEAMCYSPPYQPYFPAKVYQSAPPPPSYRRYPPYFQLGTHSGPPTPDIYERSPPPGSQTSPTGHPSGTQLVPTGPGATHVQHLDNFLGPPGYYSGYSPGDAVQCYSRSPYMEYSPQCPCPMQQSCPKNVHTGPHIGTNISNSNDTNNTEATINIISNSTVASKGELTPAVSVSTTTTESSIVSKLAVTTKLNSKNCNALSASSMLINNGTVTVNNSSNKQVQLDINRGPVINKNSNTIHQKLVVSSNGSIDLDGELSNSPHHHFSHHSHHLLHHMKPCDEIKLLKPMKSELKSEDIDIDCKSNQYEEEVVQPPTPPIAYEKLMTKKVALEKDSGSRDVANSDVFCDMEAFDLSTSPSSPHKSLATQLVIGRKARIGKNMAREMVYSGTTAKNNPVRQQPIHQNHRQTQLASHSSAKSVESLNLFHLPHSNTNINQKREVDVSLIIGNKIKSEQIKMEKDDELTFFLPNKIDEKDCLDKIKSELHNAGTMPNSSPEIIMDDTEILNPTLDGPKQRINILEFHKTQCKKSSPNSYKSLIKQTEPKSYLCLSRKIEKRSRFGKFKKSLKNNVVRKRKLVLTDQQKKSLRRRKKKLIAIEQKKEKIREKKRLAALAQSVLNREIAKRKKIKQSLLPSSNRYMTAKNDKLNDLVSRGYFSEPETHCTSSFETVGRKVEKCKATVARSKSETKKPPASFLKTEKLKCNTSTKANKIFAISSCSIKPLIEKKCMHLSGERKINKMKLSNSKISALTFEVDDHSGNHDKSTITNNKKFSETNNNDFSKTKSFNISSVSSEILCNEATKDSTLMSSNDFSLSVPHIPSADFIFLPPAIPQYMRHNGTIKRIRSRSKFGFRKRHKHKYSISFEVDESIQPKRPDVVPKWNNGWRWEGEPFQGPVFLNSDDPHVIRTCYPAMRHSEGDIIRPRDCVLLKANEDNELPYVAKVAYLWENPEDGEMMMSLLWYYRPEHTEQGRLRNDCSDEVYASRHRDHNSVACIEDKCYVLLFREYCRYRRRLRAAEEDIQDVSIVPKKHNFFNPRTVPENTNPELVMFCRRTYEFRTKRLLKMPNKHDNVTRSSN